MKKWLLGWARLITFTPVLAVTQVDDVKSFALKKGMPILVLEDNSIPNAKYVFILESRLT